MRVGVGVGAAKDTGSDTGQQPSHGAFGLPNVKAEVLGGAQGPSQRRTLLPPRTAGSHCPLRQMTMAASPWMATCSAGSATLPEPRPEWAPASPFLPHQRTIHTETTLPSTCPAPLQLSFHVQPLLPRQPPPRIPGALCKAPTWPKAAVSQLWVSSPSPSCRDHPPAQVCPT